VNDRFLPFLYSIDWFEPWRLGIGHLDDLPPDGREDWFGVRRGLGVRLMADG